MNRTDHENELAASHKRGFGGSDAAMIAKIAQKGITSLNRSEINRVLVVLGKEEPREHFVTAAMEAGHDFEDYYEQRLIDNGKYYFRELVVSDRKNKYRNFETFAHADFAFVNNGGSVYVTECKYSQSDMGKLLSDYKWQLQWYYMLGVDVVTLTHGIGGVFPFNVEDMEEEVVEAEPTMISTLRAGLDLLDDAIGSGYFEGKTSEALPAEDVSSVAMTAASELAEIILAMDSMKKREAELRERLKAEMEAHGVLSIKGESFSVTYVAPTTRRTFDTKKAQSIYPDLKSDCYYKVSEVSSSIKITTK